MGPDSFIRLSFSFLRKRMSKIIIPQLEEQKMKTALGVIVSLLLSSFVSAQSDTSNSRYALTFGISDNFTLSKFHMDIALKKMLENSNQLRFFISPSIDTYNSSVEDSVLVSENDLKGFVLGVGTDYLWKLIKKDGFIMYGGSGLMFSFTSYSNESSFSNNKNEEDRTGFTAGLRGILGTEWFIRKNISVHAEYLMYLSYSWNKNERKLTANGQQLPIVKEKSNALSMTTLVLFGLSVYF
jgi:opacity protein-like surface antigen